MARPGVVLGALELGGVPWELRAADLAPGTRARRSLGRGAVGEVSGWCSPRSHVVWVNVRQTNLQLTGALVRHVGQALAPDAGERQCEHSVNLVLALLQSRALRLGVKDRQLDAVRRVLLGAAEAEPFELSGRLGPRKGAPWAPGLAR